MLITPRLAAVRAADFHSPRRVGQHNVNPQPRRARDGVALQGITQLKAWEIHTRQKQANEPDQEGSGIALNTRDLQQWAGATGFSSGAFSLLPRRNQKSATSKAGVVHPFAWARMCQCRDQARNGRR